ncbi:MAG: hypothetical protein ACWGMT_10335, partial [Burkholderiales bacterium]
MSEGFQRRPRPIGPIPGRAIGREPGSRRQLPLYSRGLAHLPGGPTLLIPGGRQSDQQQQNDSDCKPAPPRAARFSLASPLPRAPCRQSRSRRLHGALALGSPRRNVSRRGRSYHGLLGALPLQKRAPPFNDALRMAFLVNGQR